MVLLWGGNDRVWIFFIGLWIISVVWIFWEWFIILKEKNGEKFLEIYGVYVCYYMIYWFLLMYYVIGYLYYLYILEVGIKYYVNYFFNFFCYVYLSIKSVYDCVIFCILRMISLIFFYIVLKCLFVVVKIKICMFYRIIYDILINDIYINY